MFPVRSAYVRKSQKNTGSVAKKYFDPLSKHEDEPGPPQHLKNAIILLFSPRPLRKKNLRQSRNLGGCPGPPQPRWEPIFQGGLGGGLRRVGEGSARPGWRRELGAYRANPRPRLARVGQGVATRAWSALYAPRAYAYRRQHRPSNGMRIRASGQNPKVSAPFACHVAGLSRPCRRARSPAAASPPPAPARCG